MTPTQPTATTTGALRLPEGTLSMQGNDITIAYATREDAELAFDVLEAALSTAPSGDGVPGMVLDWQTMETAPHACHVLAAYFDQDCGEWVYSVVLSPSIYPFTHWMMLPDRPLSTASTGKETP